MLVEILPDLHRRPVPQRHVVLHARAAQIEVAVLQPHLFGDRRVLVAIGNGGAFASLSSRISRASTSISPVFIFGFTASAARGTTVPMHRDDELRAQALGFVDERVVLAGDDLRHAVPVAEVDEDERAEVAHPMHPAEQNDILADVGGGELAGGVRAREFSERLRSS